MMDNLNCFDDKSRIQILFDLNEEKNDISLTAIPYVTSFTRDPFIEMSRTKRQLVKKKREAEKTE